MSDVIKKRVVGSKEPTIVSHDPPAIPRKGCLWDGDFEKNMGKIMDCLLNDVTPVWYDIDVDEP